MTRGLCKRVSCELGVSLASPMSAEAAAARQTRAQSASRAGSRWRGRRQRRMRETNARERHGQQRRGPSHGSASEVHVCSKSDTENRRSEHLMLARREPRRSVTFATGCEPERKGLGGEACVPSKKLQRVLRVCNEYEVSCALNILKVKREFVCARVVASCRSRTLANRLHTISGIPTTQLSFTREY